jgi:hypothetical protein
MKRKVFYSFHYKPDSNRVSQVRKMGALEGNELLTSNKWEEVVGGGEASIKRWITKEMSGKTCLVVLIGKDTAGRKWVTHELIKAWNDGLGVVGIYIHGLKNLDQKQTTKGANPFASITLGNGPKKLSSVVKAYDPPFTRSTSVYKHISENLADWVEDAIRIRKAYK